jgi:hypothetical protein
MHAHQKKEEKYGVVFYQNKIKNIITEKKHQ